MQEVSVANALERRKVFARGIEGKGLIRKFAAVDRRFLIIIEICTIRNESLDGIERRTSRHLLRQTDSALGRRSSKTRQGGQSGLEHPACRRRHTPVSLGPVVRHVFAVPGE